MSKMNFKWIAEIKAVGFNDWFWFVLRLKRNEFHPSLSKSPEGINDMMDRRQRAHRIDDILSNLPKGGR